MSADVVCLRPEEDFTQVGVTPPADLRVRFAAGPQEVADADLESARALVMAAVGPPLPREWLDKAGRLELVQVTGAGVDRAVAACGHRPSVAVANVPAANVREVAEYVVFAAGSLLRGLAFADRGIRTGRYAQVRAALAPANVRSLHSCTAGVVGLGQIGLAVARLLAASGAAVVYSDPAPPDPGAVAALGIEGLGLDDLLSRSDVVTLHVPLTPGTRGLIGEERLRMMPRGSLLINASRGGVVDEQALARALTDGHIAGAAIDVYEREPPGPDSPLLSLPPEVADRVLYTPHIAGVAREAARTLYTRAWANVHRVVAEGLPAEYVVHTG